MLFLLQMSLSLNVCKLELNTSYADHKKDSTNERRSFRNFDLIILSHALTSPSGFYHRAFPVQTFFRAPNSGSGLCLRI